MKLILTGSTGRVGSSVLERCLEDPRVTSIVALGRRAPAITHRKLEWVKLEDFTSYSSSVLSKLQGADVCIYGLGTNVPLKSASENRRVNLEYALSTAQILAGNLAKQDAPPFRFVYLSGALPEKDPSKQLWFLSETRKMRGELENELLALAKANAGAGFAVHIVRPGFVLADNATLACAMVNVMANGIKQKYLSAAIAEIAISGSEFTIIENEGLIRIGRAKA